VSATVPCFAVAQKHAASAARRRAQLEDLVGLEVVFKGETHPDGTLVHGALYEERIGTRCRIVSFNEHAHHAPLVVEWIGGEKGIAEPSWLTEVAGG